MNRFRGFLVPRPDWIKVLYLFGTLGLHRVLMKFSKNFKNFSFHKISKFSKNFKNSKISKKIQKFKNFKKNKNVHKACSHHVNLC